MVFVYVAPLSNAVRLDPAAGGAAPLPALSIPTVPLPLLRVPHLVAPTSESTTPASVAVRSTTVAPAHRAAPTVVVDSYDLAGSASGGHQAQLTATPPTVTDTVGATPASFGVSQTPATPADATPTNADPAPQTPPSGEHAMRTLAASTGSGGSDTSVTDPAPTDASNDATSTTDSGTSGGDQSTGDSSSTDQSGDSTAAGSTGDPGSQSSSGSGGDPNANGSAGDNSTTGTIAASTPPPADNSAITIAPAPANLPASDPAVDPSDPADLALTISGVPASVPVGQAFTVGITVTNNGPDPSQSFTVAAAFTAPVTATFNATASCANDFCTLGPLAPGASIGLFVGFVVQPASALGMAGFGATIVGSAPPDPNGGNNTALASVSISDATTAPVPTAPTLAPGNDSGYSSTDGITNVADPAFDVFGVPDLLTQLLEADTVIGSALADTTGMARVTPGTAFLDGPHLVTARQITASGGAGAESASTAITFDSIAPVAPVLDLPAAEDSGYSSTDNITNVDTWLFFASPASESGFSRVEELAPNGRDMIQSWTANTTSACFCFYFPDTGGGLGADSRQGVWTYSATFEDLAGNLSPVSNSLAITFDSIAPATMVLDLPAAEDSGYSQTDNITNVDSWDFFANTPGEAAFNVTEELAPNTRDVTYTFSADATHGCFCFYYPDSGGGLGSDGRQGVWTYQGHYVDLAGNVGATSNTLAITFDSIAPATMVLDLPAAEDSGYSQTDNITNVGSWDFFANTPGEAAFNVTEELAPNTRDVTYTFSADATHGCFCFYYPDLGGGLGSDGRQGVWTYQGHYVDLAGNVGATSNTLAITFDSIAPVAPVLDLPAAEDSGYSSTDNITKVDVWHFFANSAGEQSLVHARELAPNTRDVTYTYFTDSGGGQGGAFFYPDSGGGLGADSRQGVWTYSATFEDLAGNLSPVSNTLAITFDSIAPVAPVLDLPAAEDSGYSSTDNITKVDVWHFFANSAGEQSLVHARELAPNTRDVTYTYFTDSGGGQGGAFFYPDSGGGLGADSRQGVWTYSATFEDLAGNLSPVSNTLAITFDSIAPVAPVLDLPAAEDSGYSSTDNITKVDVWHFFANSAGEQSLVHARELAPNTRDVTYTYFTDSGGGQGGAFFYPDSGGGLGADSRQGVWTYSATFEDLAGNLSPVSNTLAITFDSIAPVAPVLDLPAAEDSGYSSTDNITKVDVWHFFANSAGEQSLVHARELAPNTRDVTYTYFTDSGGGQGGAFFYPDSGGGLGADSRQGVWTYSATFEDLAGNLSPVSNTLAITFDSIAPTGTLTLAGTVINAQLATKTPNDLATLAFTDTGGSGIKSTTISIDGGAPVSAPPTGTTTVALGADGLHTVAALVTDAAGNQVNVTQTIRVDITGPTTVVTSPAPGSTHDVGQLVPFTYTTSDVDNVVSSSATLDGKAIANGSMIDVDTLTPGTHTIVVSAKDGLGNVSTTTATFQVHATVAGLIRAVADGVAKGKIASLLLVPLEVPLLAAAAELASHAPKLAILDLKVFIALVQSQSGKKIDSGYASLLVAWTTDLIARL